MNRISEYSLINPQKLTPTVCVLFMVGVWATIYAVAPVKLYGTESTHPYILLFFCFSGMLLGFSLFERRNIPLPTSDPFDLWQSLRTLYRATYLLGLLGIVFRVIDWVVYRGFSISFDFAENVERAGEAGSNIFSMLAVFLIPLSIGPYIFHAAARRNGIRVGRPWAAAGLAVLWPCLSLLIGSRSSIFMQLGMLLIARVMIVPSFPRRVFFIVLLIFVTLVHVAGYVFIHRVEEFGLSIDAVSRLSAFTHLVPATDEYYHTMSNLNDPWRQIFFIDITMLQYFLHGVPEFSYLVENYIKGENWGAYTFTAIARIYSFVAGSQNGADLALITPRSGTYTTLFGPLYVDFGPLTPVIAFIIGGFVSWVRRRILDGEIAALPLYIVLTMQVLAAVVVNTVQSAYGQFYDLAFIGLWASYLAFRRGSRRRSSPVTPNAEAVA